VGRAASPPSSGSAGSPESSKGGVAGTLVVSTVTTAIVVLPVFQLGSLGVLLRGDFGIDETVLGGLIAAFFLTSAVTAPISGRLADRIGAKRSLLLGMGGSTINLVGLALADQVWQLAVVVMVGGIANGLVQPAANLALSSVGQKLRGLMFGIKQSGVPIATLLVGLMVPGVALAFGWRWAFGLSAFLAIVVIILVALTHFDESGVRSSDAPPERARVGPLVLLAVAAGLGIAAATSLGTFTVESAVARGTEIGLAGWLLAIGSVAGAGARLLVGWKSDRSGTNPISLMVLLLGVGVFGYLLIAWAPNQVLIFAGVIIGYAFGWGWNGLLMYAVVLIAPRAPAGASGIAQVGMSTGAALGPLGFGAIASVGSYSIAWTAAAACAAVSAILLATLVLPRTKGAMAPLMTD